MLSNNKQSGDRLTPANFINVSQTRPYVPSWLAPRHDQSEGGSSVPAKGAPGQVPPASPRGSGGGSGQYLTPSIQAQAPRIEIEDDGSESAAANLAAIQAERAALKQAQQQTEHLNAELARAVATLNKTRQEMLAEATRQVVDLALLAASRVIAREARLDPGLLLDVVRDALQTLANRKAVKVRVGAGFQPALEEVAVVLAQQGTTVEFLVDAHLDEFGCIVQTEIASVDEGLSERFQALVDALSPEASR